MVLSAYAQGPATGSLRGRVVDRSSGSPVRNVKVGLRGPYAEAVLLPGSCAQTVPQRETTSDEQGWFRFSALPAGNFEVWARRNGSAEAVPGRRGAAVELLPLAAGQQISEYTVKLPPASVVTGKVLDADGAPVRNAQVFVVRPGWTPSGLPCVSDGATAVRTDDRGIYRLFGLSSGTYGVRVAPPMLLNQPGDGAPQAYAPTYYPDVTDPAAMGTFAIAPGETRTIDFKLRKVAMVRLKGRLTGADGLACQGAIELIEARMPSLVLRTAAASSRMDGTFQIWAPPGAYRIAAHSRFSEASASVSQPLDLRTDTDGYTLRLVPQRSIHGTVRSDGQPTVDLHAVEVTLLSMETSGVTKALVGKDDSGLTFADLANGHYAVRVSGLPAGAYVKSVQYGGQEAPAAGLQPLADAALSVIVSAADAASLEGTVRDAAGRPAAYAAVTLLPLEGAVMSAQTGYTDAAGKFAFAAARPGRYKVLAWETNAIAMLVQSAGPDAWKPLDKRAVSADLRAGGRETVDLVAVGAGERQNAFLAR